MTSVKGVTPFAIGPLLKSLFDGSTVDFFRDKYYNKP